MPLLDEFLNMLVATTERYGGQTYHVAGDGLMAGFGVLDQSQDGTIEAIGAGPAMLTRFNPIAVRWHREYSISSPALASASTAAKWREPIWVLRATKRSRSSGTP